MPTGYVTDISERAEQAPERRRDSWVAASESEPLSVLLGARLLANEAGPKLRALDFDDEQINTWADAYIERFGAGSVQQFVSWIKHQQS